MNEERNRPGVTNETIKVMRKQIADLEKRAGKLEQASADHGLSGVIAQLKDIAKAIRETGSTGQDLSPLLVKATEILNRLKTVDAAVG